MNREWNILNWNIRGINDPKKWTAIANKIEESQCSILCLQETKKETFDSSFIKKNCPRRISKFEFLPLVGASGGLLVAWNEQVFSGQIYHVNEFSLSIQFTSKHNGEKWILTNIYRPCQQNEKIIFLNWFQNIPMQDDVDWLIVGDFNYIRYPHNRSREGGNINDMLSFNEAIKGKKITWSNMQEAPLIEKLDWCFTSEAWTLKYPATFAYPLAKTTSDHVPIKISIG